MPTPHSKLKQVLAEEDTVLFIGSGISCWAGLPSWEQLIEKLAAFLEYSGRNADLVRAEATRGDLLQAASYGFDKLTKQQIGQFVREACRFGEAQPQEIHQKVVTLGPRCFITTNYDNLLEGALLRWQPDRFVRVVTNRQLTETAEIVHARALDFVFKPHGDAGDIDSIVLTREQYRDLLPGGERNNALESLKMLVASRPIVYLGFGLRDPDFLYVRDLLINTYKGGTRDHYAIMADVTEAEVDYWRRNYGVHLVSYPTSTNERGASDHTNLLRLLDEFARSASAASAPVAATTSDSQPADFVLALARHAARLMRSGQRVTPEFPLRVHLTQKAVARGMIGHATARFNHSPVEKFLDAESNRALLIGLPGAGKSYAIRNAAARFGERLHEACLQEPFDPTLVTIPILADFKLYQGDVSRLIKATLPSGLSLDNLIKRFRVKVFLDSFNEMPRVYWETSAYESDLSLFVQRSPNVSVIIGSRTLDGLAKLNFPAYALDEIDAKFISEELRQRNILITGRFRREIQELLQKPFYFELVASGAVKLPDAAHPRDIYRSFFSGLSSEFEVRFRSRLDLEAVLSLAGYEAIDRGKEAQSVTSLHGILSAELRAQSIDVDATEVINWLVSKSILLPYSGARVAFFHQSVTEFLASNELARRYVNSPELLKEKLRLTRWDQALFLTLSMLAPDAAKMFLADVITIDFSLALNAAKYMEAGREEVVGRLLEEIPRRIAHREVFDFKLETSLEFQLPVTDTHEPQLRAIMALDGSVAGAAAVRLIELKGRAVKEELLASLLTRRRDFNYCGAVGPALEPLIDESDLPRLAAMADSIEDEMECDGDDDLKTHGLRHGLEKCLASISLAAVVAAFDPGTDVDSARARSDILCSVIQQRKTRNALEVAASLLLRGVERAAFALYLIVRYSDEKFSWEWIRNEHVLRLSQLVANEKWGRWALEALRCLSDARPDVKSIVEDEANAAKGIHHVVLLYAARGNGNEVLRIIKDLIDAGLEEEDHKLLFLLEALELDWGSNPDLFLSLLRTRNTALAMHLLEAEYMSTSLGELDFRPIHWWAEWLAEEYDRRESWQFWDRLAWLLAEHGNSETRNAFLDEFNDKRSPFRLLLSQTVLNRRSDITTDEFSEDAVSFLLADLSRHDYRNVFEGHLLANTATESFVTERLLPLLANATEPLRSNLGVILRQAGARHGRRYISS